MQEIEKSYLEIKKSKFYGYLYKINNIYDVENIISNLKKEHKKAKHIVFAYKIDNIVKLHSDKEPNGTTIGLLDIINKNNLNNTLIVVVRYFGGILLGSGPLTRTYTKVSAMMIKKDL